MDEEKNDSSRGNDFSNRWRNTVGLLIVGAAASAAVFSAVPFFSSWSRLWETVFSRTPFAILSAHDAGQSMEGDTAQEPPHPLPPKLPILVGSAPSADAFTARGILVKDYESGAVLYRKNEYDARPIASITKLMSALVILEKNPDWAAHAVVVPDDVIDTHMYAGDTYSIQELWDAAMVGSSNKAILTIADAVGWPRAAFLERMNQKAMELGMAQTNFTDATGLDEANVSTASDSILLLREALKHQEIIGALEKKEHTLYSKERQKNHHMWNTNWLLLGWIPHQFPKLIGGKTGYIAASGYNFVMEAEDALGHRVDVAVFGADTHEARFTEARDIAKWAFENYQWP